ncbi:hypothetical protein [Sphingobacterium sp. LRF_L2]|uniref:hypothetical protein n=1 Tax=Sphingobacterium sp. LRF_L2 TaxID=3369421 RepID=UPI003F634587
MLSIIPGATIRRTRHWIENTFDMAYQHIYYPLREMTFFSLEDLNWEIGFLLEHCNNTTLS